MTRWQKYMLIRSLQEQGMTHRQISEQTGMAGSTIRNLINDPDGAKQRARREGYYRRCRCGAKVHWETAGDLCKACYLKDKHEKACQRVINCFRRYYNLTGEAPCAADYLGHREPYRGRKRYDWMPWASDVLLLFGTWNNAIRATGMNPRRPGTKTRDRNCPPAFDDDVTAAA